MQLYVQSSPPQGHAIDREIEILWVRFTKLLRMRREILADFGMVAPKKTPPFASTASPEADLDTTIFAPIADALRDLAHRAAKVPSKRPEDLEYKAVMLAEFLGPDDGALPTILTASLVNDIKNGHRRSPCDHGDALLDAHAH